MAAIRREGDGDGYFLEEENRRLRQRVDDLMLRLQRSEGGLEPAHVEAAADSPSSSSSSSSRLLGHDVEEGNALRISRVGTDSKGVHERRGRSNGSSPGQAVDSAFDAGGGGGNGANSFFAIMKDRTLWLIGLLTCQSMSSFILAGNEVLIKDHPVVVFFLTMLVGAGVS